MFTDKPINVLIIEDDPFWQDIITKSLTIWHCNVVGRANNLDEAIAILEQTEIDIALVDIYLGNKPDGLILGKMIRHYYHKPFIYLSNVVEPSLLNEAAQSSSSSYLNKPFTPESLFMSVKSAVNEFKMLSGTQLTSQYETAHPFFFVKNGKNLKRVEWNDVVCLQSDRNYTKVITKTNELHMIRCSLSKALSTIIPTPLRSSFVKINRAEVLKIDYIGELKDRNVVVDKTVFEVSDRYLKDLKMRLNLVL